MPHEFTKRKSTNLNSPQILTIFIIPVGTAGGRGSSQQGFFGSLVGSEVFGGVAPDPADREILTTSDLTTPSDIGGPGASVGASAARESEGADGSRESIVQLVEM
jgi:hypothetical protein